LVLHAMEEGKELHELSLVAFQGVSELFSEEIFGLLTPEQMINRRGSTGGTAKEGVVRAIKGAKKVLAKEAAEG
ncbi:MAG: argininosuccinate lyase, partial [Thermodesulfobacteriota bacterium]|nr:argininosuccinate lyase [Thermodesulfobacteriota bacterium]